MNGDHPDIAEMSGVFEMARPIKRSLKIGTHRTSVSVEESFWEVFRRLAKERNTTVPMLVKEIDDNKPENVGLSSAMRTFVLTAICHQLETANNRLQNTTEE